MRRNPYDPMLYTIKPGQIREVMRGEDRAPYEKADPRDVYMGEEAYVSEGSSYGGSSIGKLAVGVGMLVASILAVRFIAKS